MPLYYLIVETTGIVIPIYTENEGTYIKVCNPNTVFIQSITL